MEILGLDGKTYRILPSRYLKAKGNASKLSREAIKIITEVFPGYTVMEEVPLFGSVGSKVKDCIADFMISSLYLVIEVHGRQHYEYTPHFHRNKRDFLQQKRRDQLKKDWCELNQFCIVELSYNDKSSWKQRLENFGD